MEEHRGSGSGIACCRSNRWNQGLHTVRPGLFPSYGLGSMVFSTAEDIGAEPAHPQLRYGLPVQQQRSDGDERTNLFVQGCPRPD